MMPAVVRLSLSGAQVFPNFLVRRSELTRVKRMAAISFVLSLAALAIDFSSRRSSLIWMNVGTLAVVIALLLSLAIIRERGKAAETGASESDIEQIRSVYPILFLMPALTLFALVISRMFQGS